MIFGSVNFTSNPLTSRGPRPFNFCLEDFSGCIRLNRQGMFFLVKYHLLTCINPKNDASCVGINIVSKMVWGSFTRGPWCLLQITETATGLQRKKPPHLGSTYHCIHTEPAIMLNSKLVVTMCLNYLRLKKTCWLLICSSWSSFFPLSIMWMEKPPKWTVVILLFTRTIEVYYASECSCQYTIYIMEFAMEHNGTFHPLEVLGL